jgi:hypothetical protein
VVKRNRNGSRIMVRESDTTIATERVEDAEVAIGPEENYPETSEKPRLILREPVKAIHDMMGAIEDSMRDCSSSDDGEDGDNENDENAEQGRMSEDDKPGWVMGKISEPDQQRLERSQQKQM